MVEVVGRAGIDPFPYPGSMKVFGVKFIAQMPIYIVGKLKEHEQTKCCLVNRQNKTQNQNNPRFNDGFKRVESISRPRGWVSGFVMDFVN